MFGDPLQANITAPGLPVLQYGQVAAAGGTTAFFDVSPFESIVVSCNTGIGAGSAVTFTFQWFDQQQGNPMNQGGFFPAALTVAGGTGSLNGVRMRNLGPFLQVTWTASGGPQPFLAIWGSNHQVDHDGPYCGTMHGQIIYANPSNATGAQVITFGGTGATVTTQYCGPALLNIRSLSAVAGAFASIELTIGGSPSQMIASLGAHDFTYAPGPVRVWVPPQPFTLTSVLGGGTTGAEFSLVAGW